MATSSITKNFVISGKEQVEMFVNAIEESAKNRPVHIPVAASEITDDAELLEFMRMRKKANDRKKQILCFLLLTENCWGILRSH